MGNTSEIIIVDVHQGPRQEREGGYAINTEDLDVQVPDREYLRREEST